MNRLVAVLLALALSVGAVFGQGRVLWQDGGVQLCGPSATEDLVATSDGAGGAIVVWSDARQWPDGIYAQRVNGSGDPLWTDSGIAIDDSSIAGRICVVADGENGAIVVWGPSSAGASIAVQRLDADGTPLWGANGLEIRPLVINPPLSNAPAVARDGHGGAIVAWTANVAVSGPLDTLIVCRVDSSGTKRWETVVRMDTMNDPPTLCQDGHGGGVIAWSEHYLGPVRVQCVDSAGSIRWDSAGVLACTLSAVKAVWACVAMGESSFAVGFAVGPGWHDRAQMFDLAGNRLWGPIGVPVTGTSYSSSGCVALPTDVRRQSIWLWSENRTGTTDLFVQKLDSAGIRGWDSTGVWLGSVDTSGGQFSAAIDGRGGAIAAWTLYRSRLNWDVYAQHVDSSGRLCWSDTGLAVCLGDDNVRYPVAVTDGDGGAIIVWLDDRGLYVQRVADVPGGMESVGDERRAMDEGPTVARGMLLLAGATSHRPQAPSWLSDAVGRKVLDLKPGANDVRALAPGVYFVREAQAQAQAQAVRKIVKLK